MSPSVLTSAQLQHFRDRGYVVVRGAFPADAAREIAQLAWQELDETQGVKHDDASTWGQLRRMPKEAKVHPVNRLVDDPRLHGAIQDAIGPDWKPPKVWGGFLMTFPQGGEWTVPADTWHWDGPPAEGGLVLFSFYSSVRPGGGGTSILAGSPRLIAAFYESLSPEDRLLPHKTHRKLFSEWTPWLAELTGRTKEVEDRVAYFMEQETEVNGIPCQVVELTGEPGDAVICNPAMLHAISPNCAEVPRVMRAKIVYPAWGRWVGHES